MGENFCGHCGKKVISNGRVDNMKKAQSEYGEASKSANNDFRYEPNKNSNIEKKSNKLIIWVILGIVLMLLLINFYEIGKSDGEGWTPEKEKEAIDGCKKWGGNVIKDNQGNYIDCDINRGLRD